jgi:hypothetical protein
MSSASVLTFSLTRCSNCSAYNISARTAQKTSFLCCCLRAVVEFFVSRSLHCNGCTCHNIYPSFSCMPNFTFLARNPNFSHAHRSTFHLNNRYNIFKPKSVSSYKPLDLCIRTVLCRPPKAFANHHTCILTVLRSTIVR